MKQLLVLFCFTLFSVTASAVDVDFYVTDKSGCEWHVEGTIDFTWTGAVDSYDVTVTDCNGNVHNFSGIAFPGGNGAYTLAEMTKSVKNINGSSIKPKSKSFIYIKGLAPLFPKK